MSDLAIIHDGAVFIENGKISGVGTTEELRAHSKNATELDCHNKVILPGFVDSHTHPVFANPRLLDFESAFPEPATKKSPPPEAASEPAFAASANPRPLTSRTTFSTP
jgi:imidazolonepropionase-like amidohydrolase